MAPLKNSRIYIMYGRNYSGKKTLSRTLRALELGDLSDKYEKPDFDVSIKNEPEVTNKYLSGHSKKYI